MPKQKVQHDEESGRQRTQPTEPPRSGGSYDAETGTPLHAAPVEQTVERDENRKE